MAGLVDSLLSEGKGKLAQKNLDPLKVKQSFVKKTSTIIKEFRGLDGGQILQVAEFLRDDQKTQEMVIELGAVIDKLRQHWKE